MCRHCVISSLRWSLSPFYVCVLGDNLRVELLWRRAPPVKSFDYPGRVRPKGVRRLNYLSVTADRVEITHGLDDGVAVLTVTRVLQYCTVTDRY